MKRIRWAKDVALPKIQELFGTVGIGVNNIETFYITMKAGKYIPDDPHLKRHLEWIRMGI